MKTQSMSHPWQEMRRLQREMEQIFTGHAAAGRWSLTGEYPPLNVTREDNGLTLEVLCPGVDRSSLDVSVVGDAVTIRGERKAESSVAEERYYRRERPIGTFTRTIRVGERLEPDHAQATYKHGILRMQLARAAEATPKKIPIAN